jgi:hypothetical protein
VWKREESFNKVTVKDKVTVIKLVRWSFNNAGFRLNLNHFLAPLSVNPHDVLEQIARLECTLDQLIDVPPTGPPVTPDSITHKSHQISDLNAFVVILQADIKTVGGECSLCGYIEEQNTSKGQETTTK